MTRVKEAFSKVRVSFKASRCTLNEATGNLWEVRQPPPALKRRGVVSKVVLGALLVIGLFGVPQKGWTLIPTIQAATPTTIKQVEPAVTQPGETITLTFDQGVIPATVKIANTDAPFVPPAAAVTKLEVKVADNAPLGTQGITVTLAEGGPILGQVIVAPLISGLKAYEDAEPESSRGAIAGGQIIIELNDILPSEMSGDLKVEIGSKPAPVANTQSKYLVVNVPGDLGQAPNPVNVFYTGKGQKTPLKKQLTLNIIHVSSIYLWASGITLFLIFFIYFLYKVKIFSRAKGIPDKGPSYSFLTMALLEQENMTYSLSRAQFLAWLLAIIWAYVFLYVAHGYVEKNWDFPGIGGAVYTFLISLGTLVVAQATSIGQGAKGAGETHPRLADLVVHGGVLALDRVQQVLWTIIAIGIFIRGTVTGYETATELPAIPEQLLVLMGLSSAGYLGGKLVRGAGPIIEQVTIPEGGTSLNIKGKHFSKDCFIWVDGIKQPKDPNAIKADDPDSPAQYASEIEVKLAMSLDDWRAKDHAITVVNDDAQRADWRTGPDIVEVTPSPVKDKKVTLTIKGARLAPGAALTVSGDPNSYKAASGDPNLFTVVVDQTWLNQPHVLTVTSNGQTGLYTYKPSNQTSDGPPDGGQSGSGGQTGSEAQTDSGQTGGAQGGSGQIVDNATSVAGETPPDQTQADGSGEQSGSDSQQTGGDSGQPGTGEQAASGGQATAGGQADEGDQAADGEQADEGDQAADGEQADGGNQTANKP